MINMIMRKILSICFLLITINIFSQETKPCLAYMQIIDSIVVKEQCKSAIELKVRLLFPQNDTIVLYKFHEFVNSELISIQNADTIYSVYDAIKNLDFSGFGNPGLFYVVEDEIGRQIKTGAPDFLVSSNSLSVETKHLESRYIVCKNRMMTYKKRIKDNLARQEFDLAKLLISRSDTIVTVYPMITKKLEKGSYIFYLCYSQNDINQYKYYDRQWDSIKPIFTGTLVSNKIQLLVR